MCDPLTVGLIISAATSAGSAVMQNQAQRKVRKKETQARNRFEDDLEERRGESRKEFEKSLEAVGPEEQERRQAEAVDQRLEASDPSFNQSALLPGQGNASKAVRTAIVQAQNQGIAKGADLNKRRATLEAFGDADLGRNLELLQNSNRISQQGDFAGGAGNVLNAGIQGAQSAGDGSLAMADAIGAIGAVAGAANSARVPNITAAGGLNSGSLIDLNVPGANIGPNVPAAGGMLSALGSF